MPSQKGRGDQTGSSKFVCSTCGCILLRKFRSKHEETVCQLLLQSSAGLNDRSIHYASTWGPFIYCGTFFGPVKSIKSSNKPNINLSISFATAELWGVVVGQPLVLDIGNSASVHLALVNIDSSLGFCECAITWSLPGELTCISAKPYSGSVLECSKLSARTVDPPDFKSDSDEFDSFLCLLLQGTRVFEGQSIFCRYFVQRLHLTIAAVSASTSDIVASYTNRNQEQIAPMTHDLSNLSLNASNLSVSDASFEVSDANVNQASSNASPFSSSDANPNRGGKSANSSLSYCDDFDKVVFQVTNRTKVVILDQLSGIDLFRHQTTHLGFSSIGGMLKEKAMLRLHVLDQMGRPESVGISVLLFGVSGTGKSLLLNSLRKESEPHRFVEVSKSVFGRVISETEANLSKLFHAAKSSCPSILSMDDLEIFANIGAGNDAASKRLCSNICSLIDSVNGHQVSLVAVTGDVEALPLNLRRRFELEIEVNPPTQSDRAEIIQAILRNRHQSKLILRVEDTIAIAEKTQGYTGSDLIALCKLAERRKLIDNDKDDSLSAVLASIPSVRPSAMREISLEVPRVRWSDIGGIDAVRLKLQQMVEWPLKHPDSFKRLGIEVPCGVLLYGPPGCSKTMIARALATESDMNFFSVKGPELFSKWVGESERTVRELFRKARSAAPAIIFFDEIDAIASTRTGRGASGSSTGSSGGVGDRVLAQLLTEMDGVEPLSNVVVVAATNRPDAIDSALLRPGRFDRHIYIQLPDLEARREIIRLQVRNMPLSDLAYLVVSTLAETTDGFSGAELKSLCQEAAMLSLCDDINAQNVSLDHFLSAQKVIQPSCPPELLDIYEKIKLNK